MALSLSVATSKVSAQIPYPNSGTVNPVTYSFTAAATGDIVAYFAGTGAAFDEQLGLLDNGVLTPAGFGLDNQTSAIGDSFDLGTVTAGDTLTFVVNVLTFGLGNVYSDPSLNGTYDAGVGVNHVYSTPYTAGSIPAFGAIPSGTYVGFEDLPAWWPPDYNYFDETYVFSDNVSVTTHGVPDATSTLSLFGLGLSGLGLIRRRFRA